MMTAVAQKTVLTGCLASIDKNGLEQLIANGKANPKVIKTLKCKTVAEGNRHANYIRNLAPWHGRRQRETGRLHGCAQQDLHRNGDQPRSAQRADGTAGSG
jgi:hypothetical protein